jgi:hypothetical protein
MALGLKLAQPSRRVVQVVGDGAFHFSSPDSVYATAQQYQLPIFTVVLDNGGWQAVKASIQRVYPDGMAQRMNSFQSRLASGRQGEQRRFADVASAFGSYGEEVVDPVQLDAAIDRCLPLSMTGVPPFCMRASQFRDDDRLLAGGERAQARFIIGVVDTLGSEDATIDQFYAEVRGRRHRRTAGSQQRYFLQRPGSQTIADGRHTQQALGVAG